MLPTCRAEVRVKYHYTGEGLGTAWPVVSASFTQVLLIDNYYYCALYGPLAQRPSCSFRKKGTDVFVSGQSWTCGGGWQAVGPAFPLKRDLMEAPVLNMTFAGGQSPPGAGLRIPRSPWRSASLAWTSPKGPHGALRSAWRKLLLSLPTPTSQPCGKRP